MNKQGRELNGAESIAGGGQGGEGRVLEDDS